MPGILAKDMFEYCISLAGYSGITMGHQARYPMYRETPKDRVVFQMDCSPSSCLNSKNCLFASAVNYRRNQIHHQPKAMVW